MRPLHLHQLARGAGRQTPLCDRTTSTRLSVVPTTFSTNVVTVY
ncbi:hypothetical protein PR003_g29895 [Phytophthora rubi]|uniref:Uncharacterized protein n=1 Tax=Phytophthora rubi TaxID=129364 RepID=A0A6A4BGM4_9STRA|nr:hypothetical protein PR003_g29895 [Phytophthora rubi]